MIKTVIKEIVRQSTQKPLKNERLLNYKPLSQKDIGQPTKQCDSPCNCNVCEVHLEVRGYY